MSSLACSLMRGFQEGLPASERRQHFVSELNIPLGILWTFPEAKRKTAHLSDRSVAGSKRAVGNWSVSYQRYYYYCCCHYDFDAHSLNGNNTASPQKETQKTQRPHLWAGCFPGDPSSQLSGAYCEFVPGCSDHSDQISVNQLNTQRNSLSRMHFTSDCDKPGPVFKVMWQIWHNYAQTTIFTLRLGELASVCAVGSSLSDAATELQVLTFNSASCPFLKVLMLEYLALLIENSFLALGCLLGHLPSPFQEQHSLICAGKAVSFSLLMTLPSGGSSQHWERSYCFGLLSGCPSLALGIMWSSWSSKWAFAV